LDIGVIRLAAAAVLLCSLLLASACGGSDPASDAQPSAGSSSTSASPPTTQSSASPEAAGSADDAFCTGFEENGGSLASIGVPPVFYPKEQLVSYAQETLAVMKGLTPPQPIAAAWTTYQQFQTRLLAAAQALDAGQRLGGPVAGMAATAPAYKKINAWITANC